MEMPELVNVQEFADWAQVHPNTVRRWYKEGRIEGIRIGHKIMLCVSAQQLTAITDAEGGGLE